MPSSPDVRLALTYQARYNRLRTRTGLTVGRLWDRYAGVDDEAAERFTTEAAGLVGAAQSSTTALVNGYLTALLILAGERDGDLEDTPPMPRGVDLAEVYSRPIITARTALAEGKQWADAMSIGRNRAVTSAATDISLAQRDVMSRAVDGTRIVGYRRTLTGQSCALCATASTQRYTGSRLMPIHGHCDCGVAPIIGDRDPGQVINRPLLNDLKAAGKQAGDPDYWKSRKLTVDEDGTVRLPDIDVHEHGELGPVLTVKSHDFTGPGGIAA